MNILKSMKYDHDADAHNACSWRLLLCFFNTYRILDYMQDL